MGRRFSNDGNVPFPALKNIVRTISVFTANLLYNYIVCFAIKLRLPSHYFAPQCPTRGLPSTKHPARTS